MTIDRRRAMALLGGAGALTLPALAVAEAGTASSAAAGFNHGVASGDPATDGAVIWTRVTPLREGQPDIAIEWHVSEGSDGKPMRSGKTRARTAADYTVKVEVEGLKAGRDYWYWFTTEAGQRSPTGRFRTLPRGATDKVVMAVASCQLYPGGLFNAYADMAALPRLDAVVHLGDYIYEYGKDGYGADIGRQLGRLADPPHEILTLADYRRRHAQVKSDPDLQAAHARAAFICVWDDHESANDAWVGGAQNHDSATEGDWKARKAAALQAYFEWMPIREPRKGQTLDAINRSFEFGDLATLAMVETRLLARSEQASVRSSSPTEQDYAAALATRNRPDRELLGAAQLNWLENVLGRSVKAGKPWQVLGNQVVMARVDGPDLLEGPMGAHFADAIARLPDAMQGNIRRMIAGFRAGLPFNLDSWDGYPHARERLYQAFHRAGSRPLVLAGDSHAAWANDLYDADGKLVAAEFGATAITSPSYGAMLPKLGEALAEANREVVYCDQESKGYTLLTLTPESAVAEFVTVSTVLAKPFERNVAARYRVVSGPSRGPLARA